MRAFRIAVFATATLLAGGCAHKRPYGPGKAPDGDDLLALAKPQIQAVQVAEAKVVLNRALRGDMAFIAQAPGRFRGGVGFAGNELVTLAFHEEGYALRYKLDAFPQGFYEGPADRCAVQALLGITMDTNSLVSLMLGGAPLIDAPFEVIDQNWSRKRGWEALVIRNAQYIEELRFDLVGGDWQFVGGEMYERNGDAKGKRLWTVEHKSLTEIGGAILPERMKVSTPGKRKDDLVTIIYKQRNTDPEFAKTAATGDGGDGGDDGGGDDGWDDGGNDGGDDGWEEDAGDDGWEDEPAADDGWDDAPAGAAGPEATPPAATTDDAATEPTPPTTTHAAAPPSSAQPTAPQPTAPPKSTIPEVFRLVPGTLTERGDLCR